MGIGGSDALRLRTEDVLREVRRLRDEFVSGVLSSMEEWEDDHLLQGEARFRDDGCLIVDGDSYRARKYVVATGSRAVVPDEWGSELGSALLTSDNLFDLDELPKTMAVAGLGSVGAELAQALGRLGVTVCCFDPDRHYGTLTDDAVASRFQELLEDEVEAIIPSPVQFEKHGTKVRASAGGQHWDVDAVLVAMGRSASLDELALEHAGVELGEQGYPEVNEETLRIPGTSVYMVGDAPVLHEAADSGRIAGFNAARHEDTAFSRRVPVSIVFTSPQIAVVGQSRQELQAQQMEFVTGEATFDHQGRARMEHQLGGVVHVYLEKCSGRLLGAEMAVPGAEHFAHLLARELDAGTDASGLLRMPFYHPTLEEGLRSALRNGADKCDLPHSSTEVLRHRDAPVS